MTTYDANLAAPGYYNGTGPVNGGFTVATDTTSSIELGLRAENRFTGPIASPTNTYTVVGGLDPTQLPKVRATWNYDFSINLAGSVYTLADFLPGGRLAADLTVTDLSNGNISQSFDPTAIPDNSTYGTPVLLGTQNSENLGFNFGPGPILNPTYLRLTPPIRTSSHWMSPILQQVGFWSATPSLWAHRCPHRCGRVRRSSAA